MRRGLIGRLSETTSFVLSHLCWFAKLAKIVSTGGQRVRITCNVVGMVAYCLLKTAQEADREVGLMKKILLTSVSGPLGTGVINAIRAMDEPWHIIGLDSNPVYFLMADVYEKHLVPRIDHELFYDVVRQIVSETQPDFFWPLHDNEMPTFAGMHDLDVPMFLPSPEAFEITQDKMAAYEHFKSSSMLSLFQTRCSSTHGMTLRSQWSGSTGMSGFVPIEGRVARARCVSRT